MLSSLPLQEPLLQFYDCTSTTTADDRSRVYKNNIKKVIPTVENNLYCNSNTNTDFKFGYSILYRLHNKYANSKMEREVCKLSVLLMGIKKHILS